MVPYAFFTDTVAKRLYSLKSDHSNSFFQFIASLTMKGTMPKTECHGGFGQNRSTSILWVKSSGSLDIGMGTYLQHRYQRREENTQDWIQNNMRKTKARTSISQRDKA